MSKKSFLVLWSDSAESDLTEILQYILQRNPENLEAIFTKLESEAKQLNRFPERGRVIPELAEQYITNYRERIVDSWRSIYKIMGDQVLIAAVIDGRRDFSDHLLKRILRVK